MAKILGVQAGDTPGTIKHRGDGLVPGGYLLCDGSAVSRTTYSALFANIGTTWGIGDGINTFNLPDLRGRTGIGAGTYSDPTTGTTTRTLGGFLGEAAHYLSEGELAPHSHGGGNHSHGASSGGDSPGHTHNLTAPSYWGSQNNNNKGWAIPDNPSYGAGTYGSGGPNQSHTHGISVNNSGNIISSDGGGAYHNNMQPSAVVTYVIKF